MRMIIVSPPFPSRETLLIALLRRLRQRPLVPRHFPPLQALHREKAESERRQRSPATCTEAGAAVLEAPPPPLPFGTRILGQFSSLNVRGLLVGLVGAEAEEAGPHCGPARPAAALAPRRRISLGRMRALMRKAAPHRAEQHPMALIRNSVTLRMRWPRCGTC